MNRLLAAPALALAVLFAGFAELARAHHAEVSADAREDGRTRLDADGQNNGVQEALAAAGLADVRILDALAVTVGLHDYHPHGYKIDPREPWNLYGHAEYRRTNVRGASEGVLQPALPPGPVWFLAWAGEFRDRNENGVIDQDVRRNPDGSVAGRGLLHEWRADEHAVLLGFIDPAFRPALFESGAFEPGDPDVRFSYLGDAEETFLSGGGPVVFPDGSLLQTVRTIVVQEAMEEGARALVDIDDYAALAPGPAAKLYASTVAPFVDAVPVSLAACGPACDLSDVTPIDPFGPLR
ncbi:MAG TPA: hypothetical protein VM889_04185 [Candidatus Thermoplasmatota archaeon]|nr:hypothetical protein [Candidatus Thermoplasmatota archaeon]